MYSVFDLIHTGFVYTFAIGLIVLMPIAIVASVVALMGGQGARRNVYRLARYVLQFFGSLFIVWCALSVAAGFSTLHPLAGFFALVWVGVVAHYYLKRMKSDAVEGQDSG